MTYRVCMADQGFPEPQKRYSALIIQPRILLSSFLRITIAGS